MRMTPTRRDGPASTGCRQSGGKPRPRHGVLVQLFVSLSATLATTAALAGPPEVPGHSLSLSFSDSFETLTLYDPQTGTPGWKTNYAFGAQSGPWAWNSRTLEGELQVYTDATFAGTGETPLGLDPFRLTDEGLTIHARRVSPAIATLLADHAWTSGLLTTEKSFAQTYGYFEIRARLPEGAGLWPAFWLLPLAPEDPSELDVFEQTGGTAIFQSVHRGDGSARTVETDLPGATTGFHDYGLLWTPETLTFYLDGALTASEPTPASMHQPMYLLVNLAISGGGWAGTPDPGQTGAAFDVRRISAYALDHDAAAAAITGTDGADEIRGTGRADLMRGGPGDDSYLVNAPDDRVVEAPGEGHDTIRTMLSATLPAEVEDLTLIGYADSRGTGNAQANRLTGNTGRNRLEGLAGDDWLTGGLGPDVLVGGPGNDTYAITDWYGDHEDLVIERPDEGHDRVESAITWQLSADVEDLVLTGDRAIDGTGNALANRIEGNAAANRLDGGGGDDELTGGEGPDIFVVGQRPGDLVITDFTSEDRLSTGPRLARLARQGRDGDDLLLLFGPDRTVRLRGLGAATLRRDGGDLFLASE